MVYLVVYLLVFQHVPVERCAQLIADVTGAKPSTGFVHGMLARAVDAVKDVVALIKTLITASSTDMRINPHKCASEPVLDLRQFCGAS